MIKGIIEDVLAPPRPSAERPQFPLPTAGDVVRLTVMLDDFRHKEQATIPAAILVAAACARVHNFQACQIRIGMHWSPEDPGQLLIPDLRVARPMHLLPVAQYCFLRVVETYGKKDGMLLFSAEKESEVRKIAIRQILGHLGGRLDLDTGNIFPSFHAFFDNAIPPETNEETVFALTGPKYPGGPLAEIEYDAGRVDKLRRILEVNHPLAGPAGAFLGTRGRNFIAAEPTNLPATLKGRRRKTSPAFDADPEALELRAEIWPEDEKLWNAHRLDLKKKYWTHIRALWDDEKLTKREVAFLFNAPLFTVEGWVIMANHKVPRSEAVDRPKEEWKKIFAKAYLAKGTKGPFTVWRETAHAEKCPYTYATVQDWWKKADLMKRPRGRPKKARTRPRI